MQRRRAREATATGPKCQTVTNSCQRAAESSRFGARNFPHLAGLVISRLGDRGLRSWAAGRDACAAPVRPVAG